MRAHTIHARNGKGMGQTTSCCASCCPCLWRRRRRAAAVLRGSEGKTALLPPASTGSSKSSRKPLGNKTSKYRRPPSHLRELSGEINQVVRLVLVGGCDTGKTCLLRRFLGGYFDEGGQQEYIRTLGVDFGCKTMEVDERRVRLQMWDTGGSETYRSVVSHYLRGADGVILCFDVNRKTTLRALRSTWAPFLDKHTPRTCRVLLAGNKADCRGDLDLCEAQVSREDTEMFAEAIEAQLFETSAKLGTNVEAVVLALVREVLHHRQYAAQESSSPKRKGRRRLSAALKDLIISSNDGDISSSCASSDGQARSTPQGHSSEGTVTEGTSSAGSTSASQKEDGDNSDQDVHIGQRLHRSWAFPDSSGPETQLLIGGGGGGEEDRVDDMSALGNSVNSGYSIAGSAGGGLSCTSRDDERTRSPSGDCGSGRGGRYDLVNRLVRASPSRGTSASGSKGGLSGDVFGNVENTDGARVRERAREHQSEGGILRRGGRRGRRKAKSRTVSPLPTPGSAGITASPRRPRAAPQGDSPPRDAPGTTPRVDDQRERSEVASVMELVGDTSLVECARRRSGRLTVEAREAPRRSPKGGVHSGPRSEATAAERKSQVRDGDGLRSTPTSASASFSTTTVGENPDSCRLAAPVTGET